MRNNHNNAAQAYAENKSNIEKLIENLFDSISAQSIDANLWHLIELAFSSSQSEEISSNERVSLLNTYKAISSFVKKAETEYKLQLGLSVPTIMESSPDDLKKIVMGYMSRYDDLIQKAADLNYPEVSEMLGHTYNDLNTWVFNLKDRQDITVGERNQIRMSIKNAEKQLPGNIVLGVY
jgi:CRP-like cAMP-binding protein